MDFLGNIGGVIELLLMCGNFVLGGYLTFHSRLINIGILYKFKENLHS